MYLTLAGWVQRYRRAKPKGPPQVRLLDRAPAEGGEKPLAVVVELPGGARLAIGESNKCRWQQRCCARCTSHVEFFKEYESVRGAGSVRHTQRL
jgi:hypothetical protein